jgi:hypothetical protein
MLLFETGKSYIRFISGKACLLLEITWVNSYNRKSVLGNNIFQEYLALMLFSWYNRQCWSLTAMKRKVADTPGRFAMASAWEIFAENVYFKIGEKEGK